jgi:hypothetical protein
MKTRKHSTRVTDAEKTVIVNGLRFNQTKHCLVLDEIVVPNDWFHNYARNNK